MTASFLDIQQTEQLESALAKSNGRYISLSKIEGEKRIRFVGQGITGLVAWTEPAPGEKNGYPIRWEVEPSEYPENIQKNKKTGKPDVKDFLAGIVWDYDVQQLLIVEITQKTVRQAIAKYMRDSDYGDPHGYDFKISREGEGINTEYTTIATPPKKLSDEIQEAWDNEGNKIVLAALYDGEDPFKDC